MGDIRKKYSLPMNLEEADEKVKEMVVKGALRTYVKNFYEFGRPILAKMYKIDKGENGQRFISSIIFNTFAGNKSVEFKDAKPSKYRNLSLVNLAFYCNYLQSIFTDLVDYYKEHKDVSVNTFEARITNYGNFMRSLRIKPNICMDKSMANQTDYKESMDIYTWYDQLNSKRVQDLINSLIKEKIFAKPDEFESPFTIDLEFMKNNDYFDRRKEQYFNYAKYPKEIEKLEEMYKQYLYENGLAVNAPDCKRKEVSEFEENWKNLSAKELINLDESKAVDEEYTIYDDLEM